MRPGDIGNWTDNPCYYVTAVDGPTVATIAGPFRTHQEALDMVDVARDEADKVDGRAWFYSYGTARFTNGHRAGVLNDRLERRLGILI